jgi:hypothetical protein
MITLTIEELTVLSYLKQFTRNEIIQDLQNSLSYIDTDMEKELTCNLLNKLRTMTDSEYNTINYDNILEYQDVK